MQKLSYITVLRAIAILSVLIIHVKQQSDGIDHLNPYLLLIMDNGARGVQLFYLLSAFTLFRSFNYRRVKEINIIKNYFIRRFFRIAPLFYLAIIYYIWQDGLGPRYTLGDADHITISNIISNFTFLNGFNPYWINSIVPGGWSVAVEAMFYCFLPLIVSRVKSIQQAFNFIIISLLIRCMFLFIFTHINVISDQRLWHEYLFLYIINQLPVFALGIFLYYLIYDIGNFKLSAKSLLIGSCILILNLSIKQELLVNNLFYFGLAFILLVLAFQNYNPKMFFNPVIIYIGNLSYTLYLTHFAALHFLNKFKLLNIIMIYNESSAILNFLLNYIVVLFTSVILSTIIYHLIEKPMQKIGKRFEFE